MQKIKFDFEATKERIYAPNSNVPIGAPVDRNGNIANDGNAYGIVLCKETENEKYWVRYNLVVMVAGYCDIIDAQAIWGDEYSAEAIAAMSDITFCDNHELPTGGGWPADLPKPSVGGYGYTDEDEIVHKIDEKYLPASGGGAMVVEFEFDFHNNTLTASKTVDEVKTAMFTIPVIGVMTVMASGTVVRNTALGCASINEEANPVFGCYYNTANGRWMEQIGVQAGEWELDIEK